VKLSSDQAGRIFFENLTLGEVFLVKSNGKKAIFEVEKEKIKADNFDPKNPVYIDTENLVLTPMAADYPFKQFRPCDPTKADRVIYFLHGRVILVDVLDKSGEKDPTPTFDLAAEVEDLRVLTSMDDLVLYYHLPFKTERFIKMMRGELL
jgi:hypothetical protein